MAWTLVEFWQRETLIQLGDQYPETPELYLAMCFFVVVVVQSYYSVAL